MLKHLIFTLLVSFGALAQVSVANLQYTGINEAGLEFGGAGLGCAPQYNSISQFSNLGHNLIRIPFGWEAVQPCIRCELNQDFLNGLTNVVNTVLGQGGIALIDCHNYFRYYGSLLLDSDPDAYANLWWRLAQHFTNNDRIWFGLMNEPHDMSTEQVFKFHQQAIWAIRGTGNRNKIVISGNGWDSLTQWANPSPYYGSSNTQLAGLDDPAKNNIFEMHIYFDYDGSGTHSDCTQIDWNGIEATTNWLRSVGKQTVITEFGLGNNDNCAYNYGEPFLSYLQNHADVYLGYTYWSAGPCWPNDYIYTLDPNNGIPTWDARVQLLSKYSAKRGSGLSNNATQV